MCGCLYIGNFTFHGNLCFDFFAENIVFGRYWVCFTYVFKRKGKYIFYLKKA